MRERGGRQGSDDARRGVPVRIALTRLSPPGFAFTLAKAEWNPTSIVRDVVGEVPGLKQRYAREVQVHGSAGLAQTLIEDDLVDVYHLLTFPVVLGTGKRLFGGGAAPKALKLIETRTTSAGVIISSYQRAGRPTYGSFALAD